MKDCKTTRRGFLGFVAGISAMSILGIGDGFKDFREDRIYSLGMPGDNYRLVERGNDMRRWMLRALSFMKEGRIDMYEWCSRHGSYGTFIEQIDGGIVEDTIMVTKEWLVELHLRHWNDKGFA